MPISKKKYLTFAIIISIVMFGCLLFIPAPYNWITNLVCYLLLLFCILNLSKASKACVAKIREYDSQRQYKELVKYAADIAPLGYKGFVIDSYVLYAHYELGDFKAYEETVLRMMKTKQWSRPKFENFTSKVEDNLACINLLKTWADTGEVKYKGDHLMMIQAVDYYHQNKPEEIVNLMKDYPKIPKLKKACLYALSNHLEGMENFYESDVATNILEKIKERNNG